MRARRKVGDVIYRLPETKFSGLKTLVIIPDVPENIKLKRCALPTCDDDKCVIWTTVLPVFYDQGSKDYNNCISSLHYVSECLMEQFHN